MKKKKKSIDYGKWGYIFILPFFVTYIIFSLIPLIDTVRYSFFEYYRSGIKEVGPNFIGMANYVSLLHSDMLKYGANTLILWMIGFIPQIVIALVLAAWFTDVRLKIRGQQFFKVVIYLPNLIMASDLDGCNSIQRFFYITLPLIRPILAYTLITSIIGGLQMFDVPQILTNGQGNPNRTSMTLIMFLNSHLKSKNYGMAGALSVYLFVVSAILCFFVYRMTNDNDPDGSKKAAKKRAKAERRKR